MKTLLGLMVIVACLAVSGAAHAQGSCAGLCATAQSQCHRHVADLAGACRRAYGANARVAAECQRRERAYMSACTARYKQCVRACGRR